MDDQGVQFPRIGGRRSTQRAGSDVFAAAAGVVDPGLAVEIRNEGDWRTRYPIHLRHLTAAAARSPSDGAAVARAGLARIHGTFAYVDGPVTLRTMRAVTATPRPALGTRTITGSGAAPDTLVVPYRGADLHGARLLAAVDDWVGRGIVEPGVRTALADVVAHPERLDLTGTWFGVLGAGAEMAPTAHLLQWGAEVAAVDVRDADVWRRLEAHADAGTGRLHMPVSTTGDYPLGADLTTNPAGIRAWLDHFDQPLVLGNYAYADGPAFVRLSVAADAVIAALRARRADHRVVCLATPTDAFAVSADVVRATRERAASRGFGVASHLVRTVSAGRLLVPNYGTTVETARGEQLGIADSLVLQQGPNYALAKRLQRWRALTTHADGGHGAIHVAPPTRTRSVMRNRILAAAYGGASLFGVEVFAPETSRAVMAALLVHDLRRATDAAPTLRDEHTLTAAAAHGGLWSVAWELRTALPLAVARGAPAVLIGR